MTLFLERRVVLLMIVFSFDCLTVGGSLAGTNLLQDRSTSPESTTGWHQNDVAAWISLEDNDAGK